MLTDGVLSTQPITSYVLPPRDRLKIPTVDYEYGPVNISDPTQGSMVKTWTGTYENGWVVYSAADVTKQNIFQVANLNELSITFDQNARPTFGFCDDLGAHLYWFDTLTNQYEVLDVGTKAYNPRVMLDDKRHLNVTESDVLFFYILNGNLYGRYQRERFQTEHLLVHIGVNTVLDNIGMN